MMPITRREIEILLDSPNARDYVVSAYADMTVQDGFNRHVDTHLRNQVRAMSEALGNSAAARDLEANIEVIRQAVQEAAADNPGIKGLAVFSSVARQLRQVVPLHFPVENRLVVDEEAFVLPLLERWYGDPAYLVALADSDEAHLFEAHHGRPEPARDIRRDDVNDQIQRDKPRFTYKKRFAQTRHERLHGEEDSKFVHEVAEAIAEHWSSGNFEGLILLGRTPVTATVRKLLPRELQAAVVGEAAHAMTTRAEELADNVARFIEQARDERDRRLLAEFQERRKQNHLVGGGATEVLDALQQGRATQILLGGSGQDLPGARCRDCGYRFGAPVELCPYCQGRCRTGNAVQDIMRLAMRHQVPIHICRRVVAKDDPLAALGGVAALLRAEANWAPNGAAAQASLGH